jgi:hypothetical protein
MMLELGADPVGAGDEDRVLVALRGLEQPGEAADLGQDLGPQRAARDLPDLVDETLVVVEVDARLRVAGRAAVGVAGLRHAPMDRRAPRGAQTARDRAVGAQGARAIVARCASPW